MFDIFILLSLLFIVYTAIEIIKKPNSFVMHVQGFPIVGFMLYARFNGMTDSAWMNAFIMGGLLALIVVLMMIQKRHLMDRVFLGINFFLICGAAGFLFGIPRIIQWYSHSNGAPFFASIFMVGLLTTFFTKTGFIGKKGVSTEAIQTGSFLLLAAAAACLVWSIQMSEYGLRYAVIAPFILLRIMQDWVTKRCMAQK